MPDVEGGILPYITIPSIAIDDIERKVLLYAGTYIDGNLDEHGITIYLSNDHWHFEDADYFIHYAWSIEKQLPSKRENFLKRFGFGS